MKTKKVIVFLLVMAFGSLTAQAQDAQEIVKKANDLLRGQSNESVMTMKIIRPKWERTLKFKGWSKGNEYSLIYVLEPAKEKGQVFLKRDKEIWNWVPSIERMIKIPPSMMMQSWMGSDLTNDDLVKESSIVEDYNHKVIGEEKLNGYDCYKIEMTPKEDAAVVWGKIITWISKEHYYTLQNEYYDEDGYLVNVETLSKIKKMGDRTLPTYYEIVPVDKKGHKTTMEFNEVKFNVPIKDSFFSIQNMKRVH